MEKNKFYKKTDEMDMQKVYSEESKIKEQLSLAEIFKMAREIAYGEVSFYSENDKGIIYNGEYTQTQIDQATKLQQKIRDDCDCFTQIICNKREFEKGYADKNFYVEDYISSLESENEALRRKIESFEEKEIK